MQPKDLYTKMEDKELQALILLLDDPDSDVFTSVAENLKSRGASVVPNLERAWETALDEKVQERLENIIHDIQFNMVAKNLSEWRAGGGIDLLEGAYWVAKFQYPQLKMIDLELEIDKLKRDVWLELNEDLTALEKVRIINHIFYEIYGYAGNSENFFAAQNSYINQVIETRKGNPISLSILYSLVAQELDIPIVGVNLPKSFILAYVDEIGGFNNDNILFYINPYSYGTVLSRKDIEVFLQQQRIEEREDFYKPCTHVEIASRLILNLINSYEKSNQSDKIPGLKMLFRILNPRKEE